MATFLAEAYVSETTELGQLAALARSAAEAMTKDGIAVRYVRSILVPEDEICFHVFESPSQEAVVEAGRRVSLTFNRVVEAIGESTWANDGAGHTT